MRLAIAAAVAARAKLRGQVDSALQDRAGVLAGLRSLAAGALPGPGALVVPPGKFGGPNAYAQAFSTSGAIRLPPGQDPIPISSQALKVAAGQHGPYLADEDAAGVHLRVLTIPLGGGVAVQIARPLTEVDHALGSLRVLLIAITGGGVLLGLGLGWVVSRTALAPVRSFTHSTEKVSDEPLGRRLDVDGEDELGRLARSFNSTLEALESSVASQRQLVADASHELRTPLSSLRTNVQVLARANGMDPAERERLLRDLELELDELTALVGDVVELARGAQPAGVDQSLRLDELVQACVEKARRRAPQASFDCSLEPLVVRADPARLGRAIDNLLDNAAKWNLDGRPIEVTRHSRGGPAARVRPLLPCRRRAAATGLGPRARDRAAGGRGTRRVGGGGERRRGRSLLRAQLPRRARVGAGCVTAIPAASMSTMLSKLSSRSVGIPKPPAASRLEKPCSALRNARAAWIASSPSRP
jgi:two-component system sensor histidine kinase MprB